MQSFLQQLEVTSDVLKWLPIKCTALLMDPVVPAGQHKVALGLEKVGRRAKQAGLWRIGVREEMGGGRSAGNGTCQILSPLFGGPCPFFSKEREERARSEKTHWQVGEYGEVRGKNFLSPHKSPNFPFPLMVAVHTFLMQLHWGIEKIVLKEFK